MGDEGLEPATNRLRVYCSTIELVAHQIYYLSKFSRLLEAVVTDFSQNFGFLAN